MEKPLNQRVAEALGCKVKEHYAVHPVFPYKIEGPLVHVSCGCGKHGTWRTNDEGTREWDGDFAHYDTDWSATGPLIEKYGFFVRPWAADAKAWPDQKWIALEPWTNLNAPPEQVATGPTPLIAVCNLILILHAAGKVKAA